MELDSDLGTCTLQRSKRVVINIIASVFVVVVVVARSPPTLQIAIGMWTDVALKDLAEPFRLWYIYADTSRRRAADRERLLRLYRRSKNRIKCHRILKAWKHFVSIERGRPHV